MKAFAIKINKAKDYLKLWNGLVGLTDVELHILGRLVELHLENDKPLFSFENKSIVAEEMKYSDPRLMNTYVMKLKAKGVVFKTENGTWVLKPMFYPQSELIFKLDYENAGRALKEAGTPE